MGTALNRNKNLSFPGPSHYRVDVQLTRVGKDGTPKYSIAARWVSKNSFIGCKMHIIEQLLKAAQSSKVSLS